MTDQPPANMSNESPPECDCETAKRKEADSAGSKSNSVLRCCTKQKLWLMLHNKYFTDVCFVVGYEPEVQRIEAHKSVLSAGSTVFEAMFSKNWSAESKEIEVPDIEPAVFSSLLRFIYSDDAQLTADSVIKMLYAAKKYEILTLEKQCSNYLKEQLTPENVCVFLTQAKLYDAAELMESCMETIDEYAEEALLSNSFTCIDVVLLRSILERDTLKINEVALFEAVLRWSVAECQRKGLDVNAENQTSVLEDTIPLIRFPLMTLQEFVSSVLPFDLLSKQQMKELFQCFGGSPDMSSSFISNPRSCKEVSVVRRFGCNHYSGWPCKAGQSDGVGFSFSHNVRLVGFGMFHSDSGGSGTKYKVAVTVKNQKNGDILYQGPVKYQNNSKLFTFRVLLGKPLKLIADTLYAVIAEIEGPDSIYGTEGVAKRCVKDSKHDRKVEITFQSIDYGGSDRRSNVNHGQIPELLFYW